MALLRQPRIWLLLWGGIGVVALFYIILSASGKPDTGALPSALDHDRSLLAGEMADFEYAFPPRGAPEASFQLDGEALTLKDFRGRAVLVNLWATWCAPCLKELPSLDALEGELGGRRFEVVAIASDAGGPEAARTFMERLEINNLKLYVDPTMQFAFSMGGADVLPVSILYDAEGREVGRLVGEADWASPEAVRLVASVIP